VPAASGRLTDAGAAPRLECVPNVSEGRAPDVIADLAAAVKDAGAELVDVHSDVDHHRSVFTFLGASDIVERAALALAAVAVARIDLRQHAGAHPRVGAVDVVPFVPLRGATMAEAAAAARRVGTALAARQAVPVFFYGEAALRPAWRELPAARRGGFERLAARMCEVDGAPDVGPPAPHPTAGATIVGARGPLIAFNAVLDGGDLATARAVASAIRETGGGLSRVRALGLFLESRGLAQVAMNLLDYRVTPVAVACARLAAEARRRGATVREYELVGCAPADALAAWPGDLAPIAGLRPAQLLPPELFAAC
jgi:glutamate formiminotransferase